MRRRLVRAHGQHGVEQQHALFGPAVEIARSGNGRARIVVHLLEYVDQRGRERHAVADRKAQSVGLPRPVIRVLSDDDHFQIIGIAHIESPENIASGRENPPLGVFLLDEIDQLPEIGLVELPAYPLFPFGRNLDIHIDRFLRYFHRMEFIRILALTNASARILPISISLSA